MSARKNVCKNTLAFVLLDVQTVSSIGIDDVDLGSQALALAAPCDCDVCSLIKKLFALSGEDPRNQLMDFYEYFGLFYKDKVFATKSRSFRFRVSRSLSREIEACVDLMLENHEHDCELRQRIIRYSKRMPGPL